MIAIIKIFNAGKILEDRDFSSCPQKSHLKISISLFLQKE